MSIKMLGSNHGYFSLSTLIEENCQEHLNSHGMGS